MNDLTFSFFILLFKTYLCWTQQVFNTTIGLVSINVPDGNLYDGSHCDASAQPPYTCWIGLSLCIDSLESNPSPTRCSTGYRNTGLLTKSNYFVFSNATYGAWDNPQYITFKTTNAIGFLMTCHIINTIGEAYNTIDMFVLPITYSNSSYINYDHPRPADGNNIINLQFWWDNPYAQVTTTAGISSTEVTTTQETTTPIETIATSFPATTTKIATTTQYQTTSMSTTTLEITTTTTALTTPPPTTRIPTTTTATTPATTTIPTIIPTTITTTVTPQPTTSFYCLNGGTVTETKTGCLCLEHFTGQHCEIIICNNGGTSIDNSTCICKPDYTDQFCDTFVPGNCWHIYTDGNDTSNGTKTIYVNGDINSPRCVFCEMGWTVIQKRYDGSTTFARPWSDYALGFGVTGCNTGCCSFSEDGHFNFWVGNDNLHTMTNNPRVPMKIRFIFKYCTLPSLWVAVYKNVKIGDANTNYVFTADNCSDACDYGAGDGVQYFNGAPFSTVDNDNTGSSSCSRTYDNSGFWFDGSQCLNTLAPSLNGVFPALNYTCFNEVGYAGILWTPLTGQDASNHQSLHYSEMQLAPMDAPDIP